MTRKFKTPDYEATLNAPILLKDALPQDHLARFVVDIILQLDLSKIYVGYAEKGGEAIAPETLLGLLFYGYASGIFSSRKLEKGRPTKIWGFGMWQADCTRIMTR
jgi:transposase